jgi:hypothetical protein
LSTSTTRRSIFGLLALPFVSRSTPASAAPAVEVLPNNAILTLDPSDPDAVELALLWDELRSSRGAEIETKVSHFLHEQMFDEKIDDTEWSAACDESSRLTRSAYPLSARRRKANHAMLEAIVGLHTEGDEEQWLVDWYSTGEDHRAIQVGRRLYVLTLQYDAEWSESVSLTGNTNLTVIDFGSEGGAL